MLGFLYPQIDDSSAATSSSAIATTTTTSGGGVGGMEEDDNKAADEAESELVSFFESVGFVEGEVGSGDNGGSAVGKDVIMMGEEMEGGEDEGEGMVVEGEEEEDMEGQEVASATATTTSATAATTSTTTTSTTVTNSRTGGARAQKQLAELLDHSSSMHGTSSSGRHHLHNAVASLGIEAVQAAALAGSCCKVSDIPTIHNHSQTL